MGFIEKYGPWALVAGASEGVGAAFAEALAQRGLNVVLVARRQQVLDDVAEEIRAAAGVQTRTLALDPDVIVRSHGAEIMLRGAAATAARALQGARFVQLSLPALINGDAGVVNATDGWPISLLAFRIAGGRITGVDVYDEPARIAEVDLTILGTGQTLKRNSTTSPSRIT